MLWDVYGTTKGWRDRYGDTFTVRVLTGEFVVTGDPALVREILRIDPGSFGTHGHIELEPMIGTRQIFSKQGAEHRSERKLLMPPFHGERMRAYGDLIREATDRHTSGWRPGDLVRMLDVARNITSEVITRAVFGVQERSRIDAYLGAIEAWVDAWKPLYILVPALRQTLGGWSPWARFLRARQALEDLLDEEIASRRASGERGEDILSLLMDARYDDGSAMDDITLRDELRTLLFAGHETTMIAIGWAFHFLHRDRPALDRVLQGEAGWVDAVIKESLRIHPIIPAIFRPLRDDAVIGDYAIEADTTLAVSIVLLHSHPELFPEPGAWRPQRFVDRTFKPWQYLPFGGGHRRCVGAAMAEYEARIAIEQILGAWELEAVDGPPVKVARRNVSLAPTNAVPLRVRGRR